MNFELSMFLDTLYYFHSDCNPKLKIIKKCLSMKFNFLLQTKVNVSVMFRFFFFRSSWILSSEFFADWSRDDI